MAKRVQMILDDDVDGGAADETVRFALDGVDYEIDLSTGNAERLREDFAKWIGHGRRVGGRRSTGRAAKSKNNATEVREWLRSQGHEVSDRGRIAADLQKLYDDAH